MCMATPATNAWRASRWGISITCASGWIISPADNTGPRRREPRCPSGDLPGQPLAESLTAPGGLDKQPFHFTDATLQRAQGDATGGVGPGHRQQQAPTRRRIAARQGRQFFRKILKTQVHAEEPLAFAEQHPRGFDIAHCLGRNEVHVSQPVEADFMASPAK